MYIEMIVVLCVIYIILTYALMFTINFNLYYIILVMLGHIMHICSSFYLVGWHKSETEFFRCPS